MIDSAALINEQPTKLLGNQNQESRTIEQAQESIYRFLLDIIKLWSAEDILQEFHCLFIEQPQDNSGNSEPIQAINELIAWNNEQEFHYTFRRCCYILLNNWKATKKDKYIHQLVEMLSNPNNQFSSSNNNRLKLWLYNFLNTKDYEEIKLLASKCQSQANWSDRYTSNLSGTQPNNLRKPTQQQVALQDWAKPMQHRSKFDLAMYMARSSSSNFNNQHRNPTQLSDEILRLIKVIIAKREPSSYANIANTFIKQNKAINYQQFKQRLHKYLIYAPETPELVDTAKVNIFQKLVVLDEKYHNQNLTNVLLMRTCNRVISYLITENHRTPSALFNSLISQGNHMTLVIALLKIILICKASRPHLETCIAELSNYYENAPQTEVKSLTNFIEIYKVMFAIYVDNMSVKLN